MKTTVVIADDHPLFRSGVKQELLQNKNIEIVGEAENGINALKLIKELKPDIAILDIRMPGKTGLQILSQLSESNFLSTKIIFLTMFDNTNYLYRAISEGVNGYLLKDDAVSEIGKCIKKVIQNKRFISSSLVEILNIRDRSDVEFSETSKALSSLTATEKKILKLIANWNTNNEIAEKLFISPRTVGNHRTNISQKLNLRGSYAIIKFALENRDFF